MYKKDLVLNNLRCLICHKTKPNQIESINALRMGSCVRLN